MSTKLRFSVDDAWAETQGLGSTARIYLLGAFTSFDGGAPVAIAVGDPLAVTAPHDTFAAVPIATSGGHVDFGKSSPTMREAVVSVDDGDHAGIAVVLRTEGLASQWKPYEDVTEKVVTAASSVLTASGGQAAGFLGGVLPSVTAAVDALINAVFPDRNADPRLAEEVLVADLNVGNAHRLWRCIDAESGVTYTVVYTVSRDDRDWRWDAPRVTAPEVAVRPGDTCHYRVELHNVGHQVFDADGTSLVPVLTVDSTRFTEHWGPWFPEGLSVKPVASASPGEDLVFEFDLTAPSLGSLTAGKGEVLVLPRIDQFHNDGLVSLGVPFGHLPIVLPYELIVPKLAAEFEFHGPVPHMPGALQVKFSARDAQTSAAIHDADVAVLSGGQHVGTAADLFTVRRVRTGHWPDFEYSFVPDYTLQVPGYEPAPVDL